jgi:CrcB protein
MLLWIALGGALGTTFRYLLGAPITSLAGGRFPLGTLVINVLGAFAIGLCARYFLHDQTHGTLRAALMIGVCGGFTTFSSFNLETIGLIDGGLYARAALYVTLSVVLTLLATIAGNGAGRWISPA